MGEHPVVKICGFRDPLPFFKCERISVAAHRLELEETVAPVLRHDAEIMDGAGDDLEPFPIEIEVVADLKGAHTLPPIDSRPGGGRKNGRSAGARGSRPARKGSDSNSIAKIGAKRKSAGLSRRLFSEWLI